MIDEDMHLEEGGTCPCEGCKGTLEAGEPEGCSCHLSAPCSACENAGYVCSTCGFDSAADFKDERAARHEAMAEEYFHRKAKSWRDGGPDRSKEMTSTHTANPFNSTPFSRCCGVASMENRCAHCNALITFHDNGLSLRRSEVGADNCLMCGEKKATASNPLGSRGTCCC